MRSSCKLIPDFIIPNLENATYGHHLQWEDKEKGAFRISRVHQSSDRWKDDCIEVYKAWSLKKHLWKSDDPKRITKAKHRLITALRRNPEIEMLKKETSYYRFRVVDYNTDDKSLASETSEANLEKSKDTSSGNCKPMETENNTKKRTAKVKNKQSVKSFENNKTSQYVPMHESTWMENEVILSVNAHEVFHDVCYSLEEELPNYNNKCCCDILLDSTFLCNEMCIWHGMPP